LRKSQYFPFNVECQTRELLVPFLELLWYDEVLDWGLNLGPTAFEASTLPLKAIEEAVFSKVELNAMLQPYFHTLST